MGFAMSRSALVLAATIEEAWLRADLASEERVGDRAQAPEAHPRHVLVTGACGRYPVSRDVITKTALQLLEFVRAQQEGKHGRSRERTRRAA